MSKLTTIQWLAICLAALGAISGGGAQLADLVGPIMTKSLVAGSGLLSTIISSILVVLTGQSGQVQAVRNMPGVDSINVNEKASPVLAGLALAPAETKIQATSSQVEKILEKTVKDNE